MKVELNYDPVKPETTVCIDGKMTERTDIYGFLYPVRNCLLQTWLRPTGSWNGLARQLQELSRGDNIALAFRGRPEDFEDVQSALEGTDKLALTFQQQDPLGAYAPLFAQIESQIRGILDENPQQNGKETIQDLFPEALEEIQSVRASSPGAWMHVIRTDADFYLADQAELCCCVVKEEYLDSYEKLEKLNSLTRSMRRSQDMICCCIGDSDKRSDFTRFAAQFDDLEMRFDTEETCVPILERKYGAPYILRCKYRNYQRIQAILEQCYAKREQIAAKKKELSKKKDLSPEQRRELDRNKNKLNWFGRKEPYLIRLSELLKNENAQLLNEQEG